VRGAAHVLREQAPAHGARLGVGRHP
jgi:hypothetical protein